MLHAAHARGSISFWGLGSCGGGLAAQHLEALLSEGNPHLKQGRIARHCPETACAFESRTSQDDSAATVEKQDASNRAFVLMLPTPMACQPLATGGLPRLPSERSDPAGAPSKPRLFKRVLSALP